MKGQVATAVLNQVAGADIAVHQRPFSHIPVDPGFFVVIGFLPPLPEPEPDPDMSTVIGCIHKVSKR